MSLPLSPFQLLVLAAVIIVVWMVLRSLSRHSRGPASPARICPGCGSAHPPLARFCRRCGRRL